MSIDRSGTRTRWAAFVIPLVIGAAVLAFFAWRARSVETPTIVPPLRLALAPPENLTIGGGPDYLFGLALASDGRRLVFPAVQAGRTQLYLRDLSTGELQPLPGTEDGVLPFWAPDGRAVGFVLTYPTSLGRPIAERPVRAAAGQPTRALVVKTLGVLPEVRRRCPGLGSALLTIVHQLAQRQGYTHAVYALMTEGAYIQRTTAGWSNWFRSYATFERVLDRE